MPRIPCHECGITLHNQGLLGLHVQGRKHRARLQLLAQRSARNVEALEPVETVDNSRLHGDPPKGQQLQGGPTGVRCEICDIRFDDIRAYDIHRESESHMRMAEAMLMSRNAEPTWIICPVCEAYTFSHRWAAHITQDQYHQRRKRFADVTAKLEVARHNQGGIAITPAGEIDFGMIEAEPFGLSGTRTMDVMLTSEVPGSIVSLARISASSSFRQDSQGTSFSAMISGSGVSRFINYGTSRKVTITFHPSYMGQYRDTLEFEFHCIDRRERFTILRQVTATVGYASDHDFLKPKGVYTKRMFVPRDLTSKVNTNTRPPTWTQVKWAVKLPLFLIPKTLTDLFNTADRHKNTGRIRSMMMPQSLALGTYARHFQSLLYLEELQQTENLERFNMEDVELHPEHPRYRLAVPGLAEGKPSVIVGDKIQVKKSAEENGEWYEGVVHRVENEHVLLRFGAKFSMYRHKNVNVRFVLNRMPMRRAHQAVTIQNNPTRVLFPTPEDAGNLRRANLQHATAMDLHNELLGSNAEQLETIAAIVNMPPGSVPFIVFGPPGTGKTVTIVEAMYQILQHDPAAHILACAPSNKAADLIAQKLSSSLKPAELLRLNSLWRPYKDLPADLRDYSLINGNRVFVIPTLEILKSYRVIVATCVAGGVPHGLGVKPGWFSHVFIDEAGQATEPDSMISIKTVLDDRTNIVLAGDMKQLRPVIFSTLARQWGLGLSYMERLTSRPVYDLLQKRGLTIMKLLRHWRSHPAIIRFSNELFYNNELLPRGDPVITHSMLRSRILVSATFPIVFHSIVGLDQRDAESPSYFNIDEASQVDKYCRELMSDRKVRLAAKDIGIISPYAGQCKKIRMLLNRSGGGLEEIKVGTVEEFQGQERRVIIISSVRGSVGKVHHDLKHSLGFVGDARRLNVAITRARALVIVVGNPYVLSLDPTWRRFLQYVEQGGGWRGIKMNWDSETSDADYSSAIQARAHREAEEMIQRVKSLILDKNLADGLQLPHPDDTGSDDGEDYMDRFGEDKE